MDDEEFMRTNVNTAYVIKIDLYTVKEFKKKISELVEEFDGNIIYHTTSPYNLKVVKEKLNTI